MIRRPDLFGAGLYDDDVVDDDGFIDKRMRVAADDHIDIPCRIRLSGELFVFFETDMCQQNRHVDVGCVVGVANTADLFRYFIGIHKEADDTVGFCL